MVCSVHPSIGKPLTYVCPDSCAPEPPAVTTSNRSPQQPPGSPSAPPAHAQLRSVHSDHLHLLYQDQPRRYCRPNRPSPQHTLHTTPQRALAVLVVVRASSPALPPNACFHRLHMHIKWCAVCIQASSNPSRTSARTHALQNPPTVTTSNRSPQQPPGSPSAPPARAQLRSVHSHHVHPVQLCQPHRHCRPNHFSPQHTLDTTPQRALAEVVGTPPSSPTIQPKACFHRLHKHIRWCTAFIHTPSAPSRTPARTRALHPPPRRLPHHAPCPRSHTRHPRTLRSPNHHAPPRTRMLTLLLSHLPSTRSLCFHAPRLGVCPVPPTNAKEIKLDLSKSGSSTPHTHTPTPPDRSSPTHPCCPTPSFIHPIPSICFRARCAPRSNFFRQN